MALHSLSEAARISGKSRSTIHRHVKEGRLSKVSGQDGKPAIETSELHRVYGALSHSEPEKPGRSETVETPLRQGEMEVLAAQVRALERERDSLKDERDRWAAQAERLTLLLTQSKPSETSNEAPSPRERGPLVNALSRWFYRL